MHKGKPVSPNVDFKAWAESTGVSLEDSLAGFKALRTACCLGGVQGSFDSLCESVCSDGESKPKDLAANIKCADAAATMLEIECPLPCAAMGTSGPECPTKRDSNP